MVFDLRRLTLTHNHQTRVERLPSDKHSSLLSAFVNHADTQLKDTLTVKVSLSITLIRYRVTHFIQYSEYRGTLLCQIRLPSFY